MAIKTTITTKNIFTKPSPFFTEYLLASQPPTALPKARSKPYFQLILSFAKKITSEATVKTKVTVTLIALLFTNEKLFMEDSTNNMIKPAPACINPP